MDTRKSKELLIKLAVLYWALVILIYALGNAQFHYTKVTSEALSASLNTGEIVDGRVIAQRIEIPADRVESLSLLAQTYGRENTGLLKLEFTDIDGMVVSSQTIDVSKFKDNQFVEFSLDEPIVGYKGEHLQLSIVSQGCSADNAITLMAGNTVNAGRASIEWEIADEDFIVIDGKQGNGVLCMRLSGTDEQPFYKVYWVIVTGAFGIAVVLCRRWWLQAMRGKNNPLAMVCTLASRYGFLIRQLVARDFKAKYKRSALGVAWSFLNPLMTMAVQYIVFSTLFKSDIPNYAVYLLVGIVFFNFFTEAVSMGLTSITGNASLIKKVYMPKYIYPFTRTLSSLVNFGLALIPLVLVILLTGTALHLSVLLLVFDVICMLGFVFGMCLLLATAMTFFQDVQFLWNVVSLMWMYLTPVFYPESIIPQNLATVYRMNPMYQYITFARTCIIEGCSPAPLSYLWCILSATVVLGVGLWVFKKNQDKFVLYL